MSSIKKVLCLKAKNNYERTFTAGSVYDVEDAGGYYRTKDDNGFHSCILLGFPCAYGEWQPLEEYVCMTDGYRPKVKKGDILFGYETGGVLKLPINNFAFGCLNSQFKKLSKFKSASDIVGAEQKARHEVRHVVYDAKNNKVVNDAMGECYITLAEAQEVCDEMNAPKVMKPKYTKEVEYFGMKILVPDDAKSIAAHQDGGVFVSNELLRESLCNWMTSGYLKHICNVDLNGIYWKDTLMEIK